MPVIYQRSLVVAGWKTNPLFLRTQLNVIRRTLEGNSSAVAVPQEIPVVQEVTQVSPVSQVNLTPLAPQPVVVPEHSTPALAQIKKKQKQALQPVKTLAKRIFSFLTYASIAVSVAVFVFLAAPEIYYRVVPVDVIPISSEESGTPIGGAFSEGSWFRNSLNKLTMNQSETLLVALLNPEDKPEEVEEEQLPELPPKPTRYLPPKDETLPEGDWISIPRIGVRTQFQDSEDPEDAMQAGVWKVPDYGMPGQLNMPIIMAAHRFGWDWWWQSDYWRYHSFYLLPDTEPGDRVEIISDQRKWVYEIYAGEEGTDITDYEADMILYTCKFLTSPLRHFRYARLIDDTGNTQPLTVENADLQILAE